MITPFALFGMGLEEWAVLVIAAFAGGAFGAAIGALPAFIFTGLMVIAGEAAEILQVELAGAGAIEGGSVVVGITDSIAFGPVFGPHVAFAGGAAATAYAARRGYMDTGSDYHEAKNIAYALGTKPDVLAVGGLFGVLGMGIGEASGAFALPWDPIAMGVVLSAVFHRLVLGFPVVGEIRGRNVLDMTPFEREERRSAEEVATDGGVTVGRFAVEPWLPHQYRWSGVATLGLVVGVLGAYIALATGSFFLAFGISAATLLFLNCGVEQIPVTHHITLPASTAAIIVGGTAAGTATGTALLGALVVGAAFGVYGALLGEVAQRVFYAHGDTHFDPPAMSIVVSTFTIAALALVGVLPGPGWVPLPI